MYNSLPINEVVDSISITHKFNKKKLIFLNTSDIGNGKIINANYYETKKLKGQSKKTIKKNDILFSEIRPKNKRFAYIDFDETEDYVVSTKLMVLRNINTIVNNRYFYYFITSENMLNLLQNRAENRICSFPQITFEVLSEYNIPVPDLPTQQKIAAVLSALDDKIELNNRINAELEAMAKTLYDFWFVQFDFPDENNKPYKSSGGKMTYSPELKREIPAGWEVKKLGDWIENKKSGDWGKELGEGNYKLQVNCVRGTDINGINGTDQCNPPERYILEKNSFKILNSADLIIEISGGSPTQSTGRLAYITNSTLSRFNNPLICSNFCQAITLKNDKYLYNFAFYWNSLYENNIFFGYEGKTTGIKNLLLDTFLETYNSILPEFSVIEKFYEIVGSIQDKKQKALAENQQLSDLRDWLLPMLMNGQVKVGGCE
jgi:type I restriction enzyme S subunit